MKVQPHQGVIQFALSPVASLASLETLWRRLEQKGDASFFISWTWIETWLRCLPPRVRPQVLTVERDGAVIAAAILITREERRHGVRSVRQTHFNSTGDPALDCIWIEHNNFVGATPAELWPAFLRWFVRNNTEANELVVPGITAEAICGVPDDVSLRNAVTTSTAFASALRAGGRDAILARLSSSARQQLRRNLRACAMFGELRIESTREVETSLAWFQELKTLHISSWSSRKRHHSFRHPFFERFHQALIATAGGTVQLRRISAGQVVLGYLYDFRYKGRVYAYQSGFDETRRELRPGYISHVLAMEQCAEEGDDVYDFMGGENRLKRSLGRVTYGLCWHRFARPTLPLLVQTALKSIISGAR